MPIFGRSNKVAAKVTQSELQQVAVKKEVAVPQLVGQEPPPFQLEASSTMPISDPPVVASEVPAPIVSNAQASAPQQKAGSDTDLNGLMDIFKEADVQLDFVVANLADAVESPSAEELVLELQSLRQALFNKNS